MGVTSKLVNILQKRVRLIFGCSKGKRLKIRCVLCQGEDHEFDTCPVKMWKPLLKTAPSWLNYEAKKKFLIGPSPNDCEGYIYMYRLETPPRGITNVFKIGRSIDPIRRIRSTELKNKEEYEEEVFVRQSRFHKLAESIIHEQLRDRKYERGGDGGTEWYQGQRWLLEMTIKNVVEEIRRNVIS